MVLNMSHNIVRVVYLHSNTSMILHILLNYDADNTGDVTGSMFFIQMKCAGWFSVATIADSPVIWFTIWNVRWKLLMVLTCINCCVFRVCHFMCGQLSCKFCIEWFIFTITPQLKSYFLLEILAHAWSQRQEFFSQTQLESVLPRTIP